MGLKGGRFKQGNMPLTMTDESKNLKRIMSSLWGPKKTPALRGRLKVRQPEKVNQAIHMVAVRFLAIRKKGQEPSWRILIEWPELGKVIWREQK